MENSQSIRTFLSSKVDMELPNLIEPQLRSYQWFLEEGLKQLFEEHYPVNDWTESEYRLEYLGYRIDEPKTTEETARSKNLSYEAPLRVKVRLNNYEEGTDKTQEVFFGDVPVMTQRGTFIINGTERVVISQIIRSPGVFFTESLARETTLFGAKLIPNRGAWLEMDTDAQGVIWVKIDRKRKVPVTTLLRVLGWTTNDQILEEFKDVDTGEVSHIKKTLEKDPSTDEGSAYVEIYRRLRPGDPATEDNARQLIDSMFFDFHRYDLGKVGRYKMNESLGVEASDDIQDRLIRKTDVREVVANIIAKNNDQYAQPDDIDNLFNRRIRLVGELVQDRARVGFGRMEKIIKDRMSTADPQTVTPMSIINSRPLVATVYEFFASSQLSQYMDQMNTLAELEHKRRISALGPGGLTRDRAGFEVRDVHPTHYGRICPIQTPEGANIGLINHLSTYAEINEYGLLEAPYRKVKDGKITDEIVYFNAEEEKEYLIGSAVVNMSEDGTILDEMIAARQNGEVRFVHTSELDYVNASPKQIISVSTSLIPFLEHNDANRALMGSNMQRQAVACISPDSPAVGTGMESVAGYYSGQVITAPADGNVVEADGEHVTFEESGTKQRHRFDLRKFVKSNSYTSINQKVRTQPGSSVSQGDLLVDGPNIDNGEVAVGQNLMVGFVSYEGNNYEDAIVISDRLVKDDTFTSVHIEDFSVDVSDTRLGPEVITRDIPNVAEEKLNDLDPDGIVRMGAPVEEGDILVGKISPKGESDLAAEERLLRVIFGEKSREVKDSSLRMPNGHRGKVVDIKTFSRKNGDKLPSGVIQRIQVSIAHQRKISVGDKLAGRHGNKGVIAKILPEEDMPFLPDGRPLDLLLTPLGVASRMNMGQILETHLGLAADQLGFKVATPALEGVTPEDVKEMLRKANLPENGKMYLYDGKTGNRFVEPSTVGLMYIMKLGHMVEDKLHMRSTGPYSLITQQPLGGKAQQGGQRLGEMEVWALEGYGAAYTLQEMLTIKSDDVLGRSQAYESIIKGEEIQAPHIPSSFHVLVNELKGLGVNVNLTNVRMEEDQSVT